MLGEIRAFILPKKQEVRIQMASRIKGITVEIGGDTTKLTDALRDVNNEVYNTQSQLKDVEKLLKLDPSNTELLAQKQRLLTEEVQATKEKLEALKNASEQANAALEAGTVTQDQYDALQREIIETQRALEDLETQASLSAVALQKISATGTKFQEAGGKIEGVGKSLLPVTAAITGIGAAGIKVASDFEKAMSGVQAITGATGEDFETLREKAIELGATTSFSAGEVAEAWRRPDGLLRRLSKVWQVYWMRRLHRARVWGLFQPLWRMLLPDLD